MGKSKENHGKTIGKTMENTMRNGGFFDLGLELDICEAQFGDAKQVNKAQT